MPYIWLAALTSKHSLYIVQLESQMGGGCQISGWLHYLADSIFVELEDRRRNGFAGTEDRGPVGANRRRGLRQRNLGN